MPYCVNPDWGKKEKPTESESILTSIKQLLGIMEENEEFDINLMIYINSGIAKLYQLGFESARGFSITSKDDSYQDLLGDLTQIFQNVKLFLYFHTKLSFDPPQTGALLSSLKEQLLEEEQRIIMGLDDYKIREENHGR